MAERRLALVPTRYGDDVIGGSEAVIREAAHGLAARGWEVEILTTCARSHYTWENAYEPGTSTDGELTIRRFATVVDGDKLARDTIERRIQLGLPIGRDDQLTWLNGTLRVPDLFHHLLRHQAGYHAVVLSPYLFWATVTCSLVAPAKTVVMPCLHDEYYAYLELFRPVLGDVGQVWFLSEPEHELAHRLGPVAPHHVTGAGVRVPEAYDPEGWRRRRGIERPFILYAGRREGGKGWLQLLGAYTRAVVDYGLDLDLVSMGVGPVEPAAVVADRVVDLGFVDAAEVPDVFAAAAAYVQPSQNESFSRTVMEAWLAGTPVIANAASEVVRWHCRRSGAGITYDDPDELVHALLLVGEEPAALRRMAAAGADYVLSEYSWSTVLDRMETALEKLP
ncbi:MAG TPA: glycosyltransferase [Acidimicrobiales bacterium]|nr:glycosyltransferase [Acidimicrobiales bacterium]